jgi:hypothetical protein
VLDILETFSLCLFGKITITLVMLRLYRSSVIYALNVGRSESLKAISPIISEPMGETPSICSEELELTPLICIGGVVFNLHNKK